jgi:hypothetical protein
VLKLSAPRCALAAEEVLAGEREMERARTDALDEVNRALDELRKNDQWHDKTRRRQLLDALRSIKSSIIPRHDLPPQAAASIKALEAATARVKAKTAAFRAEFAASERVISKEICEIARSKRFREAIIWQNRTVLHTGIDQLLEREATGGERGSKQRQYEELVASYIQRYSVKNDTIGFFGPVGWARISQEGEALSFEHGDTPLSKREVYFEWWCIDELARTLVERERLRPWLKPIQTPFVRVEGTTLYHPAMGPMTLPPELAAVLKCCNGEKTPAEIADHLAREDARRSEANLLRLLERLHARGLIYWDFNIPVELRPERALRRQIESITDQGRRAACLSDLDKLERARKDVEAASGNPERLDRAIEALEATFVQLTGKDSTRSAGETYAARTLIFEECRRNADVRLGPEIMRHLETPLSLLLASARWFTFELAKVYKRKLKETYIEMVRATGSLTVEATRFYLKVYPYISETETALSEIVLRRFQEKWLKILSIPFQEKRVCYASELLRPEVEAEFDAARPGWPSACHHCPDVMIEAANIEAIRKGDYRLVMGEIHLGGNTLGAALFVSQHPCPDELVRGADADAPGLKVLPIVPKDTHRLTSRTSYSLIGPSSLRLEFSQGGFAPDRSRALPISSLVIEAKGGELIARTRDGRFEFDLLQIFSGFFNKVAVDSFRIVSAQAHTPRITIDRLVICREAWRLPARELGFAFEKDPASRFLAARRWAAERDIPRFVFVKVPVEVKPFYADFDSPIYIDLLSKMIRRTRDSKEGDDTVTITEMLPTPDKVWLSDVEGRSYTSELRVVAVDRSRLY